MSVLEDFRNSMLEVASKVVTSTDKNKGAYVPDRFQRSVLALAGFEPVDSSEDRVIEIQIVGENQILQSTYYESVRLGSGRPPEPRMGRAIINWVEIGDTLWLGTDGETVFALKENQIPEPLETTLENHDEDSPSSLMMEKFYSDLKFGRLLNEVRRRARRLSTSFSFERDSAIKTFVKIRCKSKCEMPGCDYEGFLKPNGERYIEVHHIVALGDEGGDIVCNVAGVCPNCHKMAHYSTRADEIRQALLQTVEKANLDFFSNRDENPR